MTDVNVWIEIAKQAPALIVLVWLVHYFLKYLERVSTAHNDRMADLVEQYRALARENAELFRNVHAAIQSSQNK